MKYAARLGIPTRKQESKLLRSVQDVRADCRLSGATQQQRSRPLAHEPGSATVTALVLAMAAMEGAIVQALEPVLNADVSEGLAEIEEVDSSESDDSGRQDTTCFCRTCMDTVDIADRHGTSPDCRMCYNMWSRLRWHERNLGLMPYSGIIEGIEISEARFGFFIVCLGFPSRVQVSCLLCHVMLAPFRWHGAKNQLLGRWIQRVKDEVAVNAPLHVAKEWAKQKAEHEHLLAEADRAGRRRYRAHMAIDWEKLIDASGIPFHDEQELQVVVQDSLVVQDEAQPAPLAVLAQAAAVPPALFGVAQRRRQRRLPRATAPAAAGPAALGAARPSRPPCWPPRRPPHRPPPPPPPSTVAMAWAPPADPAPPAPRRAMSTRSIRPRRTRSINSARGSVCRYCRHTVTRPYADRKPKRSWSLLRVCQ